MGDLFMKRLLPILLLLIVLEGITQKTAMNKGYLIYSIGTDTTMVGYYQLDKNDFEFKVMARPNLHVNLTKGSFYPNGELKESTGYSYKPTMAGEGKRMVDYQIYTDDTATHMKRIQDGKETVQLYPGKGMVANAIGSPFLFLLPLMVNYAPKGIGEIREGFHFVLGKPRKFTIKRIDAHTLEMGSQVMGYFKVHLDERNKLKMIDGIGSSWNVIGTPYDSLDFDSYVNRFVAKEEKTPLATLSTKDSIVKMIGGVNMRIDYSRPTMRGRVIFGGIVPWGRVWRTGANEPTKLYIDKPIYFGEKELPAGLYSLFTLPSKEGWMLIVNKQTDMWGTDHDATYDLMRIPMTVASLDSPVELMTIELTEQPSINIIWESTKASISFRTSK